MSLVSSSKCCLLTVDIRQGKIDDRFRDVYDKLIEIRNQLDRLTMTQAWSLRETDLFMWQRKLDRIDDSRRDGNFFDAEGHPADLHAQRVRRPVEFFAKCFSTDNIAIDSSLPHSTRLCLHLPVIDRIGAGL